MITEKQKEDFFIRLYFNTKEGFELAGIKRAYLDFNRTLKIENRDQNQRNYKRSQSENFLNKEWNDLIKKEISTQEEFDNYHEQICKSLIIEWNKLTIGQAQKWINMTLKYWLLFGNGRINLIEKNSKFFHIPIDSYVQKGMFKETNPKPWSKINNYNTYFAYQLSHREKKTGNPPIIDEFEFFNSYE